MTYFTRRVLVRLLGLLIVASLTPPLHASTATALPADPATELSLVTCGLALLGGMILNLMPCVFPVLGLKVLGFVEQAGADRRKLLAHGFTYMAGVLLSFWTLSGLLILFRASGAQLGWGFQLQASGFVFALAVLMLVFGLSLSGVFEFGLRATAFGGQLLHQDGFFGTFLTGILATVVATPCSAPFLAPALGVALALPPLKSLFLFTLIALGLSAPYVLLSAFPRVIRLLPRPGAWMETFKQATAFPLYATVGYLLWILAGQTAAEASLLASFGLTAIAMASWCYGRWTAPGVPRRRTQRGVAAAVLLLGFGLWLGWPKAAAPTEIAWQPWSPEAVAAATAGGKTVYVDFTARWCATCQANKKVVFSNEAVKRRFHDRDIVAFEADWTNADPRITAELAKWGRSAVPFNLVIKPKQAPQPLPSVLTPSLVLKAING